jgi:hypothetical protein
MNKKIIAVTYIKECDHLRDGCKCAFFLHDECDYLCEQESCIGFIEKEEERKIKMSDKKLIIAIDMDGTIVDNEYPGIGCLKPNAKKVINQLYDDGHQIVIWTCRNNNFTPGDKDNMINFLNYNGIKFHKVNENADGATPAFPKIYYDILIDDRSLIFTDDWALMGLIIQDKIKKGM